MVSVGKLSIILLVVGLLFVGFVSSYYCVYQSDSKDVQEFKTKINILGVKNDLENGVTPEAVNLKLKYFSPCR